jgi:hypothetical protein
MIGAVVAEATVADGTHWKVVCSLVRNRLHCLDTGDVIPRGHPASSKEDFVDRASFVCAAGLVLVYDLQEREIEIGVSRWLN